ncbi:MAG: aminopeptidase N [Halobacteriovoraceae bacterium]|nr:aminopeptidase N [Halobacteriovoraceae bacterium]MCB9095204.1 aminopeptidase N [Halobacteriovoraceae bacterium]
MESSKPQTIYLKDYLPTEYQITHIDLEFDLYEDKTIVTSLLNVHARETNARTLPPMALDGEELKLLSFKVNGEDSSDYILEDEKLIFRPSSAEFVLEIKTEIYPQKNLALMGLYKSGSIFCTQNEAEGFRRITYFYDRPDVLATYKTKIIADKKKYPQLLANGNKIDSGDLEGGRHWVLWKDPFPKPCYLFALVAGDLDCARDEFTTVSGRNVALEIYVDKGNLEQTAHAMNCLKQSMKWDEERFDLEYDLDIYMIVAVDAFNMGAMENKGLNIFNSKFVLGNKKTATDTDLYGIQGVIGHEYFHNWTGNRVTCRDWFQLTLKEGLTVFRDQEFSSDLNSREVKRISDVSFLRAQQFAEDSGPFSHPIKPKSYIEINNFYTLTVYEKGSEVIRMIETIIGRERFKAGMAKYFELYDGQAVTTEDFVHAMEEVSDFDFSQFKNWYDVKGTPIVKVDAWYNDAEGVFSVNISQRHADSNVATLMTIPLQYKLVSSNGEEIANNNISFEKDKSLFTTNGSERLLILQDKTVSLKVTGLKEKPLLSINRRFSAPVYVERNWSDDEIYALSLIEDDLFNRWDYGQYLFAKNIKENLNNDHIVFDERLIDAVRSVIEDEKIDWHFKAEFLSMPSESELNEQLKIYDFDNVHRVREELKIFLAKALKDEFSKLYSELNHVENEWNAENMGGRALKNTVLDFLYSINEPEFNNLCYHQYIDAENMTDELASLASMNYYQNSDVKEVNESFINKWKAYPLITDKWFAVQAVSDKGNVIEKIKELENSAYFDIKTPNKVYNLFVAFMNRNLVKFHDASGEGYRYMADKIIQIDSFNPQVASRMARQFKNLKKLDSTRREKSTLELKRILETPKLSKDTFEIVSKTLEYH